MRTQDIKERLERGEYEVDPRLVADAIVRRLSELVAPPRGR